MDAFVVNFKMFEAVQSLSILDIDALREMVMCLVSLPTTYPVPMSGCLSNFHMHVNRTAIIFLANEKGTGQKEVTSFNTSGWLPCQRPNFCGDVCYIL